MTGPTMREPYATRVRQELVLLAQQEEVRSRRPRLAPGGARLRLALAVVIALALVVPATVFALGATPRSVPAGGKHVADPPALLLVPVIWRVRDAARESADTWIRFDTSIDLIRPKGDVELSWSTQGTAILTHVDGWSMTLGTTPPTVPWLTATTRFTPDGDGWVLTNANGNRTARLVRDGVPPPSNQALHSVPKVDPVIRAQHTDAVLGTSARAIDPAAAIGTWGLPGFSVAGASVTLSADGTWEARTSCTTLGSSDGGAGGYRLLPSGFLLATEGFIADTGCTLPEQTPPADATAILEFWKVGSIAIDGSRMTVYDRAGKALGTLERKD